MDHIDLIQIEEDDQNIFKKFTKQNSIFQKLDFELINDVHTVLGNMINKSVENNFNDNPSQNKDHMNTLSVRL